MSAEFCGCDKEAGWVCERHRVDSNLFVRDFDRAAESQVPPTPNDEPCIQDLVIQDIEARKAVGLRKYGTLLQPFNGRDALLDALRQAIEERDRAAGAIAALVNGV